MIRMLPNLLTLARIILVVPTAWYLWQQQMAAALMLMLVAGVTDAVDGGLARRFAWQSRFGELLDPVADKLLVVTIFIVFTLQDRLPLWLAAIVVARDIVIISGVGLYRLKMGQVAIAPTLISKANTALQIVALVLLMIGYLALPTYSDWAMAIIDPYGFILLALLAVVSGVQYFFIAVRGARVVSSGAP